MTIKEALAAKVMCPVSDATLDVALLDRSLTGATTYAAATHKEDVDKAVMDVLVMILSQPDIVEGGYSLSHPGFLEKIRERLKQLAASLGVDDPLAVQTPTIKSPSVW